MKKELRRRGNVGEIMNLSSADYETAVSKRRAESEYVKQCLRMLHREQTRFPGYHVTMAVRNGIPTFKYRKRDPKTENLMKRVSSTLSRVEKVLAKKMK